MKPICVIFIKQPVTAERMAEMMNLIPKELALEYHMIVLASDRSDVKVFHEKDIEELDSDKLEKLLSLCK